MNADELRCATQGRLSLGALIHVRQLDWLGRVPLCAQRSMHASSAPVSRYTRHRHQDQDVLAGHTRTKSPQRLYVRGTSW